MAVPRAKKKKADKYTLQEVISMFELYKVGIYAYLADKKKFTEEEIKEIDLFAMRMSKGIHNRDYTLKDLEDNAFKHGTNIREVFKNTNKVLNETIGGTL